MPESVRSEFAQHGEFHSPFLRTVTCIHSRPTPNPHVTPLRRPVTTPSRAQSCRRTATRVHGRLLVMAAARRRSSRSSPSTRAGVRRLTASRDHRSGRPVFPPPRLVTRRPCASSPNRSEMPTARLSAGLRARTRPTSPRASRPSRLRCASACDSWIRPRYCRPGRRQPTRHHPPRFADVSSFARYARNSTSGRSSGVGGDHRLVEIRVVRVHAHVHDVLKDLLGDGRIEASHRWRRAPRALYRDHQPLRAEPPGANLAGQGLDGCSERVFFARVLARGVRVERT